MAILVTLLAILGPIDDPPTAGRRLAVRGATLVVDAPEAGAFPIGRLGPGDRVTARGTESGGWLAIDPPAGAFCWVDEAAVEPDEGGATAAVAVDRTALRSGRDGVLFPGPPRSTLRRGDSVRLVDRPPLELEQGTEGRRRWLAVEPPPGSFAYVAATALEPEPGLPELGGAFDVPGDRADPALRPLDDAHRDQLRRPIEEWRLDGVATGYDDLLDLDPGAQGRDPLRARIDRVGRHAALADSARRLAESIERSRQIDRAIQEYEAAMASRLATEPSPFTAEGRLQASSKQAGGRPVFALIGDDGQTVAYVQLAPGTRLASVVARRVGVRGRVSYDGNLRNRLIDAREVEPLDDAP